MITAFAPNIKFFPLFFRIIESWYTYTMPLQQRVHWGSFCRPDIGLGMGLVMGLPNFGIGDLIGDFNCLSLSVGDKPRSINTNTN